MSDTEFATAMEELLATTNEQTLGQTIAGVLEFLTAKAVIDGSFYLTTDDQKAMTVIAVDAEAETLLSIMPETIKPWEDTEEPYITDADPGDEQDEPASEQE